MLLELGPRRFDVTHQPVVTGLVTLPVDGREGSADEERERVVARAGRHVDDGADALEIRWDGPMSGSPVTSRAAADHEHSGQAERMASVVALIADRFDVPVACATGRASVLAAALSAGAVTACDDHGDADTEYLHAVRDAGASVVLGPGGDDAHVHTGGTESGVGGDDPTVSTLTERAGRAEEAGVPRARIIVHPGMDAAGDPAAAGALRRTWERLSALDHQVGWSTPFGDPIEGAVDGRHREETAVLVTLAVMGGVRLIRTQHVRSVRRSCTVAAALLQAGEG